MNQHLTKTQLAMIANFKHVAVQNMQYELAVGFRNLEKDTNMTDVESLNRFNELCAEVENKLSDKSPSIVGDKYQVSKEASLEAQLIIERAGALRCEADEILVKANELQKSAFELLRKDNVNIPKNTGLTFTHETNSVIVVQEMK